MKVKRKDQQDGFKPITLEVTFETISELKTMWNQLNVCPEDVSDASKKYADYPIEVCEVGSFHLFDVVDDILKEL